MRYFHILPVVAFLLAASPTAADYVVHDVAATTGDSDEPCLAVSPDNDLVVAWTEWDESYPVGIWTQFLPVVPPSEGTVAEPQYHGWGESARIVWTWQGFLLVWISGSQIHYAISDGFFPPEQDHAVQIGYPLNGSEIDVHGLTEPGGDAGWISFTMPSINGQMVWFLRVRQNDWDEHEALIDGLSVLVDPQVTAIPGGGPPRPRVYYFESAERVAHQDEMPLEAGWFPAEFLPQPIYGTEMDASAHTDGTQGVLSLGPSPACPCNTIHFTLQTAAGQWLAPETVTVAVEDYDWPMSPNLAFDSVGQAHAFWYQLGSTGDLTPHHGDLEYWVRGEDGIWSDEGDFLDENEVPGLGSRVGMALTDTGQPVFAWTQKDTLAGEPQPRRIVLARPDHLVPVLETVPASRHPQLDAWPNPFNPRLMLSGLVSPDRLASLSIYDLVGRRLATIAVDPDDTGRFTTSWDGTSTKGRPVPAGVYLVRLDSGDGVTVRRVVLAR